jgi:YidC/Oxa1 family membrane protein insertase
LAEFQNPQQEPGTERRLLIVFAATFLIMILFQPLLKKYLPKPPEPPPQQTQAANTSTQPAQPANAVPVNETAPVSAAGKQASTEEETVVENDLYKIRFTNRGARVQSWILKKFTDDHDQPLELVNLGAAERYGYPLSLWSYDESLRNKLNSALYVSGAEKGIGIENPNITVNADKVAKVSRDLRPPTSITFDYSDGDLTVHKTFHFDNTYVVRVETSVASKGGYVTAFPMWPAAFGDETLASAYAASKIEYQSDRNIERLAIKKVSGGGTVQGPLQWAGVSDQYFAAVFLPENPQASVLVTLRGGLDIPKDPSKPDPKETQKVEVLGAAVGQLHGPTDQRLYVGPKELAVLESISVPTIQGGTADLHALVDFGDWLGVIAKPLFLWLRWTHDHIVSNWGWAIAIQTLIIGLVLSPLRIWQQKSSLEMQRVAPHIKSIQEKYKKYSMSDPRKQDMQKEIAAVYKEHNVNPAAGCLPLLIQMPFLFAYYRMLGVALDLRHAHWLWIKDLSAFDPFYVLPIILVVSMFVMQRMTPMTGIDPAQQKMMMFTMPIMMGFIFRFLAAGLNLYYAESNLISIVQQAVLNRTSLGREMRELAEKRARKKDK